MLPYRAVFNRDAWEFAVHANDGGLNEIARWVDRIERSPTVPGDYTERDNDGRELQVAVLHATAITYWADDAVWEVRVVRIEPL